MDLSFNLSTPPTVNEIKEKLTNLVKSCFPQLDDFALQPPSPMGLLIQTLTLIELNRINDALYEINKRQGNVQGIDLDAQLLRNYGLLRKPKVYGLAKITIYGEPNSEVRAGFEISGTDTSPFRLLRDVTIPASGEAIVDMQETYFTTNTYAANTLTHIITDAFNIHRVAQPAVSIPGVYEESDLSFLTRAYTWGAISNNSSFQSIMSQVASIPSVTKCNGYENNTVSAVTHQGVNFPAHSVGVVAYGGTDYEIAKAIHDKKPPGTALAGDVEVKLQVGIKEISYRFFRPTAVPLKFTIKVTLFHGYENNYEERIKTTLVDYINTLQINATILYSGIVCQLNSLLFNFIYTEIKVSKKTGTPDILNIPLQFREMPTLDPADIIITKTS